MVEQNLTEPQLNIVHKNIVRVFKSYFKLLITLFND